MMNHTLSERVEKRVREAARLTGAVAHQLGATMLPSIRDGDPEIADRKDWKRLTFQAQMLVDHVRRQKSALDVFRSKLDGDLESLEGPEWGEWVASLIVGCGNFDTPAKVEVDATSPVDLALSHAILVMYVAFDEQTDADAGTPCLEVHHASDATRASARLAGGDSNKTMDVPSFLEDAARAAGLEASARDSGLWLARMAHK